MESPKAGTAESQPLRRPADQNLSSSEEIFRLLVDAVDEYAIFALSPEGNVLTWNLGARRLKGYTAEEAIGSHFSLFYTSADIERGHPQYELEIAEKIGKYEEEGWRVKKDGTQFWANVVITALKDENGVLRGFGKVTRDLSRKRKTELELKASEERFRLMVEGVYDYAIFMLDPAGRVTTWNKGAERNKGYSASEIIGQHFSKFYPPADIEARKPEQEVKEAIQNGRFEDEGWRVRKDGSMFWANVILTPIYGSSSELLGFSKVTRDLTERKKAEDSLREANNLLEKKVEKRTAELLVAKAKAEEAVQARDRFFSIASHELKTPLTSLRLQTQIRKRNVAKGKLTDFAPERLVELCDDDERQVNRLTFLVDNMLDVSKLTSGTFNLAREAVNLSALIHDTVRRMLPIMDASGNSVTVSCEGNTDGYWDAHRLEQVFTNLLSNASKYAPGKKVEISVRAQSSGLRIILQDQGRGIPKNAQGKIFEPFERVKETEEAPGLGLGLFIIRQIIEAHDGKIWLESEVNEGARFLIDLPFGQAPGSEALNGR